MKVETKVFGKTDKGQEAMLYSITNDRGMCAEVTNFGAVLVNLFVPKKSGQLVDVVLGFDNLQQYVANPSFFGATIGPNANRIGGANYEIDGVRYQLDVNDGPNNLHTHKELGYHKVLWQAKVNDNGVTFEYEDTDGNMGFPGNRKFSVTYSLDNENRLSLHYEGVSDVKTLMNFTNHTYFNLKGHNAGRIEDHVLLLKASRYTPVVEGAIPTGELATVVGTPMDFLAETEIGKRIEEDFEQLVLTGGYDHNWAINAHGAEDAIVRLTSEESGICLEVFTDYPGIQIYTGNFLCDKPGKRGRIYPNRSAVALETQHYPNAVNRPNFPSPLVKAGEKFCTETEYKFGKI